VAALGQTAGGRPEVGVTRPRVAILGSGPSGLGAAYRLARDGKADVVLIEQSPDVGGNAGSFELDGLVCDYGSHRLHPSTPEDVLADVREMLGADLLDRPRHGRIRLMGRWIHFPLRPVDLLLRAHPRFQLGVARDALTKPFRGRGAAAGDDATFASVLEAGLGRAICESFYFPYAWKMWGQGAETLSPVQARKRVSAGSLGRMIRRVLEGARGEKGRRGHFFYPREGYGQISRAYRAAAERLGARVELETRVATVTLRPGAPAEIACEVRAGPRRIEADHVWSTIPITTLTRLLRPAAPAAVLEAAGRIRFRSMVLAYLVLPQARFTEFDAHYFPEREVPFTRMSEPKNYAARTTPADRTVLCVEIPCSTGDDVWTMDERALGERVAAGIRGAGLPAVAPVGFAIRRLENAYPIYDLGSEASFDVLDRWLLGVKGVLSFGRLGLFAHDNTHHALHMGYAAAACLRPDGTFDDATWGRRREEFRAHVVED
jgi:protoporphyrinogen oxidase